MIHLKKNSDIKNNIARKKKQKKTNDNESKMFIWFN